ncbi:SAV_6107 family HEPN domain-containing protein [Amycolatopsis sp. NPDC051061]|uniref:SAV_6107 family HEPN domain-containing protein n=1 Tax=Amycolatopsis sp. NPDC051061 TaxID=3155042 RepID=UPI003433D856
MSVKVVSPTDSGQPQLPMPLRPPVTPAAAGTHHRRPRRHPSTAEAKSTPRSSAPVDSGQPELPMSPPTADGADFERPLPESLRPPTAEAEPEQARLPVPPRPSIADGVDSEPSPLPTALRPPTAGAALERAELPMPHSSVPDSGQPELPASLRPPTADADRSQSQLPMTLRPPAPPVAAGLLAQARRGLAEAERETAPTERFIGAYLAALRGAAAVLAARGRPHRGRARPASTWVLLDSVATELQEWSAFFASNSAARAAAQAGITGKVTAESAAELVRAATSFLELVRRLVHGLPITGEAHVA